MIILFTFGFGLALLCTTFKPAMARGRGVTVQSLPGELKGLNIKGYFVPTSLKKVGFIHDINGNVVVIHRAAGEAYFGRPGDTIYEDDSLTTLANARCRIKFYNEDVVTMAPDTEFSVESYLDQKKEGKKSSLFGMLKGKAMFYALRLFKYRKTRFMLKTPTAVVGVRGTKFGVQLFLVDDGKRAGFGIRVADRGNNMGIYLASNGNQRELLSQRVQRAVITPGDGQLDVTFQVGSERRQVVLNPNNVLDTSSGEVRYDPEGNVLNQIQSDTQVKTEGEKAGEKQGQKEQTAGQGTTGTVTGGGTATGETLDITEKVTETTQIETGTGTETENQDTIQNTSDISQGKTDGEVSGIATLITDGANGVAHKLGGAKGPMYRSADDNMIDQNIATHVAYEAGHEGNDNYKMIAEEQSANGTDMKVTYFTWGHTDNKALNASHTFQFHHSGSYSNGNSQGDDSYLSWGYWEDTSGVDFGKIGSASDFHVAKGRIYHVEGEKTHHDYINYLEDKYKNQNTVFTYTGQANGLYADSSTPNVHNLSGSFGCKVNFGNRTVTDVGIDVNDGGGAPFVQLTDGSGTIDPAGKFDITNFNGTIDGNPIQTMATNASGGFAGAKAQGVGGLWEAHDGGDKWAAGEFHAQADTVP